MFRVYLGPSSGGTTICIQQSVLIILLRRLSVVLVGFQRVHVVLKHNMYQLLYICNILPDVGLQICPKHVEVD